MACVGQVATGTASGNRSLFGCNRSGRNFVAGAFNRYFADDGLAHATTARLNNGGAAARCWCWCAARSWGWLAARSWLAANGLWCTARCLAAGNASTQLGEQSAATALLNHWGTALNGCWGRCTAASGCLQLGEQTATALTSLCRRIGADQRSTNQQGKCHNNTNDISTHQNSPKRFGKISCESLRQSTTPISRGSHFDRDQGQLERDADQSGITQERWVKIAGHANFSVSVP